MILTTSQTNYFKFQAPGDRIVGKFISYTPDVPGTFGKENQLLLETNDGTTMVRCQKHLSMILKDNIPKLKGKTLTITYKSSKNVGKGAPMKIFEVDAEGDDPAPEACGGDGDPSRTDAEVDEMAFPPDL